ncbi:hypothetical protein FB45DRAFT_1064466 [Roridomyces roridus]|uniref:NACHT domain-containing protein n=1 Tax=Roridomyces roridus TaxID=1738132 RepID=A0AAD7FBW5_9AGAR|nr:hypothetical protein FB45DRAFT_1064466 [Roridomyces roridus]
MDSPPEFMRADSSISGQNMQYMGEEGLHLLHSAIAIGASYDSSERFPPPRCHPQTRKTVFEIILAWLNNTHMGPKILWLNGDAGCGKSAVSQTVAEYCAQSGQLGATFFFSHWRGDLSNGRLLFPTIAYKLANLIPALRAPISQAIQSDISILTRSLEVQVQKLIVEPFRSVPPPPAPILIVIDALDACTGDEMQHRILTLLARLLIVHRLPLCLLISSRPLSHLTATFDTPAFLKLSTRLPLDVFSSDTDVRTFLHSELTAIRHARPGVAPDPWPSDTALELLVQCSAGHFLFPATVVKYLSNSPHPAERLVEILVVAANAANAGLPLPPLDQLYHQILSGAPDPAALLRVLGPALVLHTPLPVPQLDLLLHAPPVYTTLQPVSGLVDAPSPPRPGAVRIPQHSTTEFLVDARRALHFFVERGRHHAAVARGCIRYLGECLDGAQGLDLIAYQYVRRQWTAHLAQAKPERELLDELGETRFVYSRVPAEVRAVIAWLQNIPSTPTHKDLLRLWEGWARDMDLSMAKRKQRADSMS